MYKSKTGWTLRAARADEAESIVICCGVRTSTTCTSRPTCIDRVYHRLGATNAETVDLEDPGGGRAPNCRYIWSTPRQLTGLKRT